MQTLFMNFILYDYVSFVMAYAYGQTRCIPTILTADSAQIIFLSFEQC